MLATPADCTFAHCVGSVIMVESVLVCAVAHYGKDDRCRHEAYQSTIAHKLCKCFIFALIDLLFQDAESHRLFDDIIVVRNIALVHTAVEKSRRVVVTAISSRQRVHSRQSILYWTHSSSR